MSNVVFENPATPISEEDFEVFSKRTGVAFPESARAQYLECNGGEPAPYVFVLGDSRFVVQQFLSLKHGMPGSTIEDVYEDLVLREAIIPKDLIPFATDPAGDYFCVSASTGAVSVFRSEYLPDLSKCITRLSESMASFVARFSEG